MKKGMVSAVVLLLAGLALFACGSSSSDAPATTTSLTGTWVSTFPYGVFSGQTACSSSITSTFTMALNQTNNNLTGSLNVTDSCSRSGTNNVTGNVASGNNITLQWQDFDSACNRLITGTGTYSPATISLIVSAPAGSCNSISGIPQTFTAVP